MWISRHVFDELVVRNKNQYEEVVGLKLDLIKSVTENLQLRGENQRLLDDQKFFMHRLNQVEMERAQLINAAIGIKLAVPTFRPPEPTQDEILNNNGNPFIGMGEDSPDPKDNIPTHQDGTEDLSHMPGFSKR